MRISLGHREEGLGTRLDEDSMYMSSLATNSLTKQYVLL